MNAPKELPKFKGWTVDLRLREFRKVTKSGIEFVPFKSYEGGLLLTNYLEYLPRKIVVKIIEALF